MKRALISAALASAAMLSAAQAQTIGTATTDVNIRSGPGPEHPVIGMIRDRQRANVLGCIEGSRWCQVDFRGRPGWAYSQYMTLSGAMAAVIPAPEIEVDVTPQTTVVTGPPVPTYAPPAPVVTYQTPAPVATYQPPAPPAPFVTYQAPAPVVTYQAPAPTVTYQAPVATYQAPAPVVTYRAPAPAVTYRAPTVVETTAAAPREISGTLIAPRETVYASTNPPRALTPPAAVRSYVTSNPLDPVYLEGNVVIGAGLPDDIDLTRVPNYRYQYTYVNDYPVLVDPATRRIVYVYR